MPTVPKLRETTAAIGVFKVVGKFQSHHGCQSDAEVAVGREVEEDLNRIAQHCHEVFKSGKGGRRVEDPVVEDCQIVRRSLFHESEEEKKEPTINPLFVPPHPLLELGDEDSGAGDGTGEKEGEEGEIEGIFTQVGAQPERAAPNVHRVTHRLQGEETDADGNTPP